MTGQMKRIGYMQLAQSLEAAADDSLDTLLELSNVYSIALRNFEGKESQPDPATIALGVQAQALGCRTLAQWLTAIAEITSIRYRQLGQAMLERIDREMLALGLVIPDVMVQ